MSLLAVVAAAIAVGIASVFARKESSVDGSVQSARTGISAFEHPLTMGTAPPSGGVPEDAPAQNPAAPGPFPATPAEEDPETANRRQLNDAVRSVMETAEKGDARAQLQLGAMHEAGKGTIQDFAEAARWYRKAAEQGDSEAMMRLGQMAAFGRGVPKDLVQAYVWLNLAAARGEDGAEAARDRVRGLLSDAEVREAQQQSRQLHGKLPAPDG